MSPARLLLILTRTIFSVSPQQERPPLAGLARTHRVSMNHLHQASMLAGSESIPWSASPTTLAQSSLATLGTCCRVESLNRLMVASDGRIAGEGRKAEGGGRHWLVSVPCTDVEARREE